MLTPVEKIRQYLIHQVTKGEEKPTEAAQINERYLQLRAGEPPGEYIPDVMGELRDGDEDTDLPGRQYSRHYESKEVAAQMLDGSWVAWTHWYGGGNHGDPESIDWMSDAYDVDMREETRIVKVFSVPAPALVSGETP